MNDAHSSTNTATARGACATDVATRASTPGVFDGVICFGGEDWWYHNRGHYDMQMMRGLCAHYRIVYVNSLGMRMPRPAEGRMFVTRIRRKLRSIRRGLVHLENGMSVLSPAAVPGRRGAALTRRLVLHAVRAAARARGIERPLVWVACPAAADVALSLDAARTVYQRTDRYECFEGVDATRISAFDLRLKAESDLTVFCSRELYEREAAECRRAARVDHGVDLDRFIAAAEGRVGEPADLAAIPRPRVGFVGGIDKHTFDPDLFAAVAERLPRVHFVLVGASSLPAAALARPNVTHLGQRDLADVPAYMAGCDVLVMPWRSSSWIEACNPVKLKEYLATGRPVVTTDFPELRDYEGLVRVANDADAFAAEILAALDDPGDPLAGRARVAGATWADQSRRVLDLLTEEDRAGESHDPATEDAPRTRLRLVRPPARREPKLVAGAVDRPVLAGLEETISRPAEQGPPVEPNEPNEPVNLASCFLLAGGLRPSALVAETGRSVLDLPLGGDRTVGSEWVDRLAELASVIERPLRIRIVHDSRMPPPWPISARAGEVLIEREPRPLRGPAGVVRDACRDLEPDAHLLVAEAARYVAVPLVPLLQDHARRRADLTVAANPDGSPAGIHLVRRSVLDLVAPVGFVDLKEQLIPRAIDAGLDVRIHRLAEPGVFAVRTMPALRRAAEHAADRALPLLDAPPRARGRP